MPERGDADLFEVIVSQIACDAGINVILFEQLDVLAEPNVLKERLQLCIPASRTIRQVRCILKFVLK